MTSDAKMLDFTASETDDKALSLISLPVAIGRIVCLASYNLFIPPALIYSNAVHNKDYF
jgi:hypothetical protein